MYNTLWNPNTNNGGLRFMKTVLIQGAFEIINAGHVQALTECREQGDRLVVALNTNELLASYKGREAVLPWEEKRIILAGLRSVDLVVPIDTFSPLALLKKHRVKVYCVSEEWIDTKHEELNWMESNGGCVFITTDFAVVRTRDIKARLLAEALDTNDL